MKLKDLKRGEYFTLKPIDEPPEEQVCIRGDYDRAERNINVTSFPTLIIAVTLVTIKKYIQIHILKGLKQWLKHII